MTLDTLVEAAKQLSPADRLRLVGRVWDTVAADDADVTLTPEQAAEVDRRLDRLDREGSTGIPWEDFKRELLDRDDR